MLLVGNGTKWGWIGEGRIYIGRKCYNMEASPLANPYPITSHRNRKQSIAAYSRWLIKQYIEDPDGPVWTEIRRIAKLVREGEDIMLMCWCKPLDCHGDILVSVINRHNEKYNAELQQMEDIRES